jgi:hypothetical protein
MRIFILFVEGHDYKTAVAGLGVSVHIIFFH